MGYLIRGRTGRRIRPRRRILRRKGYKKSVSKSVKRYVKRAIHRQIENKEHISYAANQSMVSWGTGTQGYSIPLLPSLGKGVNDGERIGNQIKIVKGLFKATINLKTFNSSTNPHAMPVWVKLFVVRQLFCAEQDFSIQNYNQFFKGNGTELDWQGNPLDTDLPVNTDMFRVLKTMQFKLGQSTNWTTVTQTGYNDNSPFAKKISFNWARYARKQIKFNDSMNNAQNDNLYLVVQSVYADGTLATGKEICEIHYVNDTLYEDA